MKTTTLPSPAHYNPANAANWGYSPNQAALFEAAGEWRTRFDIKPAGSSPFDLHLLLIDVQKDFCFPEGTLYVGGRSGRGAIDDTPAHRGVHLPEPRRPSPNITTTMDTHFAYQIFFPSFWVDARRPARSRPTARSRPRQIDRGEVRPNPAVARWLCERQLPLAAQAGDALLRRAREGGQVHSSTSGRRTACSAATGTRWPASIHEARLFHSFARGAQSWVEVKGGNPLTENYSVLRPEVLIRGTTASRSRSEHAVPQDAAHGRRGGHRRPGREPLREEHDRGPARRDRRAGPGARAEGLRARPTACRRSPCPTARAASSPTSPRRPRRRWQRFATPGMHLVRSTDPIESWPGIRLGVTGRAHGHANVPREATERQTGARDEHQPKLFEDAHAEGALSAASLAGARPSSTSARRSRPASASRRRRGGERGRAGDDDARRLGSIQYAGNADAVRDGHNLVLEDARVSSKQSRRDPRPHAATSTATCSTRTVPIEQAVRMTAQNYDPNLGTPLYDQTVVLLGTVLAKAQEFAADRRRGAHGDAHHHRRRRPRTRDALPAPRTSRALVNDMHAQENHIVAAMGIAEAAPPTSGGCSGRWASRTSGSSRPASPTELSKAFQVFSQSAVRASQSAANFSKAALGGFGG